VTRQELRLSEYREVVADSRHYDALRWTVVGLTYPAAFAAAAYAGSRWGFISGRAFFVLSLAGLWVVAGSLVFAQVHFYGQVRTARAQQLEKELGFATVSSELFARQPWHSRDLAFWFGSAIPVLMLGAWASLALSLALGWRLPTTPVAKDGLGLLGGIAVVSAMVGVSFVRRVRVRRKAKAGDSSVRAEQTFPADAPKVRDRQDP
jgi:hypothetical protein